jgi:hypothetical protein
MFTKLTTNPATGLRQDLDDLTSEPLKDRLDARLERRRARSPDAAVQVQLPDVSEAGNLSEGAGCLDPAAADGLAARIEAALAAALRAAGDPQPRPVARAACTTVAPKRVPPRTATTLGLWLAPLVPGDDVEPTLGDVALLGPSGAGSTAVRVAAEVHRSAFVRLLELALSRLDRVSIGSTDIVLDAAKNEFITVVRASRVRSSGKEGHQFTLEWRESPTLADEPFETSCPPRPQHAVDTKRNLVGRALDGVHEAVASHPRWADLAPELADLDIPELGVLGMLALRSPLPVRIPLDVRSPLTGRLLSLVMDYDVMEVRESRLLVRGRGVAKDRSPCVVLRPASELPPLVAETGPIVVVAPPHPPSPLAVELEAVTFDYFAPSVTWTVTGAEPAIATGSSLTVLVDLAAVAAGGEARATVTVAVSEGIDPGGPLGREVSRELRVRVPVIGRR